MRWERVGEGGGEEIGRKGGMGRGRRLWGPLPEETKKKHSYSSKACSVSLRIGEREGLEEIVLFHRACV